MFRRLGLGRVSLRAWASSAGHWVTTEVLSVAKKMRLKKMRLGNGKVCGGPGSDGAGSFSHQGPLI